MKYPEYDKLSVSIIIPTISRFSLSLTLEAIKKQTRKADEVIVITDEDRRGVCWARNEGIRISHGNLIAFLDDDCVPPEDWIEKLEDAICRHDAAGAGGIYLEVDPFLNEIWGRRKFPDVEHEDNFGTVGTGGNVMYKRSWLDTCAKKDGYFFNESFEKAIGGEDSELALRIRCHGGKLIFVPCKVTHLKRVDSWGYLKMVFYRGKGIFPLYIAHKNSNNAITMRNSILWGDKSSPIKKFFKILSKKALGPFDYNSFSRLDYFILFWLGEKTQSAGFLWGLITQFFHEKTAQARKK
jgi:GT2 family glycosyltransferase